MITWYWNILMFSLSKAKAHKLRTGRNCSTWATVVVLHRTFLFLFSLFLCLFVCLFVLFLFFFKLWLKFTELETSVKLQCELREHAIFLRGRSHFSAPANNSFKLFLTSSIFHIFGPFRMIVFCLCKPYHWERWICIKPRGHLVTPILSLSPLPSFKLDDCLFNMRSEHLLVVFNIHAPAL